MIDAFKRASAGRITAVVPYYAYGRSDKKDQPRVPITARLIADMISVAGADRLLTMDLHQGQIQGFFNIPVDELTAVHLLANYFIQKRARGPRSSSPTSASPSARARSRSCVDAPLAIVEKRREDNDDRAEVLNVIGEVRGKRAIIVDDEIDTGGHAHGDRPGRSSARASSRCTPAPRTASCPDPAIDRIRELAADRGRRHRHHPAAARASSCARIKVALGRAAHRRGHPPHPRRRVGRRALLREIDLVQEMLLWGEQADEGGEPAGDGDDAPEPPAGVVHVADTSSGEPATTPVGTRR